MIDIHATRMINGNPCMIDFETLDAGYKFISEEPRWTLWGYQNGKWQHLVGGPS